MVLNFSHCTTGYSNQVTTTLEHAPINQRFEHLISLLGSDRFLNCEGLNKEVPFFICPYRPQEHNEMVTLQEQLIHRLRQKGIKPLHIDLYDLSIEILKRPSELKGATLQTDFEWITEHEQENGKDEILEFLQGVLDVETVLVPEIADRMEQVKEFSLVIITGVGEVFPYIRSHNILNNLQTTAERKPLVMFFPGDYKQSLEQGASLDLFSRLHDDKYYRAFNVYERKVD